MFHSYGRSAVDVPYNRRCLTEMRFAIDERRTLSAQMRTDAHQSHYDQRRFLLQISL